MPIAFFLFILIPLIELEVIIKIGGIIGVFPTIALLILSAVIGLALLRREGLSTLMKARQRSAKGESPEVEALESVVIALSGCLMILPGFITDIVGLLGLFPPLRRLFVNHLKKKIHIKTMGQTFEGQSFSPDKEKHNSPNQSHVIEGEFKRNDKDSAKK